MTAALPPLDKLAELGRWWAGHPVESVRTGQTPHAVVFRQNKARVRYFPARGAVTHAPLFVSMPLINTWTVFDLLPGQSVVEALVDGGVPVYLLDWGRPGPEDRHQTLADVIDGILVRCLRRATRHARAAGTLPADQALDALGYCVGGTFLSVALARHPGLARRMALLAAPIDFHRSERLSTWADPATFPLDALVDGLGNFPADLMKASFALLKPTSQVAKYKGLWDRWERAGFRDTWAAMEQWSEDNVDFPGEAYREYVRRCYFDNALMTGSWSLAGRPVDLSQGTIPALCLAASSDHIAPPAAAFGLAEAWGGPVQTRTLRGGHVGVCIKPNTRPTALPQVLLSWLTGDGEAA